MYFYDLLIDFMWEQYIYAVYSWSGSSWLYVDEYDTREEALDKISSMYGHYRLVSPEGTVEDITHV